MSWTIRFRGIEMSSDDFTIEDLGNIERSTDTPWSIANPLAKIDVARAFLAVALIRSGKTEREMVETLRGVTAREFKRAFEFVSDKEDEPPEDDVDPLPAPSLTSDESSPSGRTKAGSRVRPVKSA